MNADRLFQGVATFASIQAYWRSARQERAGDRARHLPDAKPRGSRWSCALRHNRVDDGPCILGSIRDFRHGYRTGSQKIGCRRLARDLFRVWVIADPRPRYSIMASNLGLDLAASDRRHDHRPFSSPSGVPGGAGDRPLDKPQPVRQSLRNGLIHWLL